MTEFVLIMCLIIVVWLCWQSAEWCGPDGSVVLIRAVRSGLDRVVLELLRAGVPVNNTDHTGNASWSQLLSRKHGSTPNLMNLK